MTHFPRRSAISLLALAVCLFTTAATRPDRRIVDTVEVGSPDSDAEHGYAGNDVRVGMVDGKSFRQARGWMHYALKTFDDTPVTVACTLVSADRAEYGYDLIVEDSVIASPTFSSQSSAPTVVEFLVPFSLTKGKAHIAIIIRARDGQTPALQMIRIIQDHFELQ